MSTGCRTCRRRRVKCDERYPRCVRCERANYSCEGYAPVHRFIDENAKTKRSVKKKFPGASNPLSEVEPGRTNTLSTSTEIAVSAKKKMSLPSNLGFQGFEENICTSFTLSHLLAGDSGFIPVPWMRLHAEDKASLSGQMGIRALGAMYFGKLHHLDDVANRGRSFYGKALVALKTELQHVEKAWSLAVLQSVMILALYELIDYKSTSGWMKHAGGVAKLIEMRRPWRHQGFMDRYLLEGNRVSIALECLMRRRRCFLEHSDWKIIPWALDAKSKTTMNYLHDILCDIPGLMEDAELLQDPHLDGETAKAKHLVLSRKILTELKTLYEWRAGWAKKSQGSWREVPASCPKTREIFPTAIHFKNLMLANEMTIYNAILLQLRRLGFQVIGPAFDPSGIYLDLPKRVEYGPLYAPRAAPNGKAVDNEICRTVECHLDEERKSAGGFFLLFPLAVAFQVFEPNTRETKWLREMMNRVADSSGFEIGRNLWADKNGLVVVGLMGSCGVLAETPETAKRRESEIQATGSEQYLEPSVLLLRGEWKMGGFKTEEFFEIGLEDENSSVEVKDDAVKLHRESHIVSEKRIEFKEKEYSPTTLNMGLRRMACNPEKQHPWWQVFGIRSLHESEVWWSKFNGMMPFFTAAPRSSTTTSVEMEAEVD
ncbi:hypothetical protein DL98DRAFT_533431 [Cadophora sp. DSE1049]|nr:hypothetical protein DL98DRAFT_533431 [Cadophora sp. DSE1049]